MQAPRSCRVEVHMRSELKDKLEKFRTDISDQLGRKVSMSELVESVLDRFLEKNLSSLESS